mgnify:CR=1 FL=1
MIPEQPQQEGVDFSNYNAEKKPAEATPSTSPLTETPKTRRFSKRVIIMLGILIVLAIVQVLIYFFSRPPQPQAQGTLNEIQAS